MTLDQWSTEVGADLPLACPACMVGLPQVEFAEDFISTKIKSKQIKVSKNIFKAECPTCHHVLERKVVTTNREPLQ